MLLNINRAYQITAILQRVKSASVSVDGKIISSINKGLLIFVAIGKDDSYTKANHVASKILRLKLWDDANGNRVRPATDANLFGYELMKLSGNKA